MRTILVVLSLLIPAGISAQPNSILDVRLETGEFDPTSWDRLLQEFVGFEGVDWDGWHSQNTDQIKRFLSDASTFKIRSVMGKEPKVAFLLNVYNAFATQQILDNYPINSLMDIDGFFDKKTTPVGGKGRTLNDLAEMIRTIGKHFPRCALALAPGARAYAPLAPRAYTSANLVEQADNAARALLSEQVEYDNKEKEVTLPGIMEGYLPYFENQFQGMAGSLHDLVSTSVLVILVGPHEYGFKDIDWSLRKLLPTEESQ